MNTAALLLASANAAHPNGLANGSDQVGPQLRLPHPDRDGLADRRRRWILTFPKTLAVNDFYWNDPRGGFDFPMGHIQLLEYMSGQTLEGRSPTGCRRPWCPTSFLNAVAERLLSASW